MSAARHAPRDQRDPRRRAGANHLFARRLPVGADLCVRPRRPVGNERGVVLLLVLGIIALLSLLAVSFVFQSRLELRSAQHFESTTTADEVAGAGAQAAIRLLELDKQRRLQGTDGTPDTGNEEPFDALIDIWRGGLVAPLRLTWAVDDPNEGNLAAGDRLVDTTGTRAVGTILGVITAGAGGTVTIVTENPAAWQVGDTITNVATPATLFSEPIATVQTPGNAVDLNTDANIQNSNGIDDDNDGVIDEADEGFDAFWQNYFDAEGRLRGRYAVLIEDESAKANVNVMHNLAHNPAGAANNDPTDNTFERNEGASPFEINVLQSADDTATPANAERLVLYRHGSPPNTTLATSAYPYENNLADDDGLNGVDDPAEAEWNRIAVPGQGRSESGGFGDRANDDDDANRFLLDNWYDVRTAVGAPTFNGADDDGDGCIDEFDETGIFAGDGVDNDGDQCIDELDEGVNDPLEFRPLNPFRRQPQAAADFEIDGLDNDSDGTIDEANESDDRPLFALEDLVNAQGVGLPAGWLTAQVNTPAGTPFTVRRNLLSVQSQDRNLDRLENPRTNPNYATGEEIATAARSPFARVFDTFREVEFQTYQAAINLYDYRDRNVIRDEVQDAAGNVFAGVESVRINEVMVAPRTDIFDAEGDFPTGAVAGTPDLQEPHGLLGAFAGLPNGTWVPALAGFSGRPRGAGVQGYITNAGAAATTWEYSGAITFAIPAGYFTSGATTDTDGDGVVGDDPAVDTDLDGFADEDPANGFDDDGDGVIDDAGETPVDDDVDTLFNEDGGFFAGVPPNAAANDRTFKLVMRVRTNANAALAYAAPDEGFYVFVNNEAIYPAPGGAGAPGRWGIAPSAPEDGLWHIQEAICRLVPGANTIRFLKPAPIGGGPVAVDDVDIDWFYFTTEPDCEWIELVNIGLEPVDVSGWTVQVDAVEDPDHTATTVPTRRSSLLTIPAGTNLQPPTPAGAVQHTVLVVDGVGRNTAAPGVNLRGNTTIDQEAADPSSPDLIAYDRVWAAPVAPHQLVEFASILNIFTPAPKPITVTTASTDQIPFSELFLNEPLDDPATTIGTTNDDGDLAVDEDPVDFDDAGVGIDNDSDLATNEDPGPRNTPDLAEGNIIRGIDVAVVSLLDASGNVVDRVTYDGTQWSDEQLILGGPLTGTIRGLRSLERVNPVWAGDAMISEVSGFGAPATVHNFVLRRYPGTNMVGFQERVLADGNYDSWFPALGAVSTGVDATPALQNDVDADGNADPYTLARVKNRHLSNVGELGSVPFPRPAVVDNDGDGAFDEDPVDGLNNDGDLATDEDPRDGHTVLTALGIDALFDDTQPADDTLQMHGVIHVDEDGDGTFDEDPLDGANNDADAATDEDPGVVPMLVVYNNNANENLLTAGTLLTNTTQAGATRMIVRQDRPANALLLYGDNGTSPWAIGDAITDPTATYVGTIVAIHYPKVVGVSELIDAFTVDALILEPTVATVTISGGWTNSAAAGNPDEYTIAIADTANTLDLVWDENDGVAEGTYNVYVFGQAGALLTMDVLDENNAIIGSLNRTGLDASEGDHLIAFGTLTLPTGAPLDSNGLDDDGDGRIDELELRLRFTNAGAAVGSPATQNRVTRVVLAPPGRALGRINLNTATARVLRGLPNGDVQIVAGPPALTLAEFIILDRQANGPLRTVADPFLPERSSAFALLTNGVDDDNDGTIDNAGEAQLFNLILNNNQDDDGDTVVDEPTEVEDLFRPWSNLTTVRSDLFKIIALGQAAVDANNDGIVQTDEVRAEKKLEFVYER